MMEPIYFKVPRLKGETVRVEFWDLPYFYEPVHFHEECQITYILQGTGIILVSAKLGEFKEGDLFFIGKNQSHVFRHDESYYKTPSKHHARAISIFFSLDTFKQILQQIPEGGKIDSLMDRTQFGIRVSRQEVENFIQNILEIRHTEGIDRIACFMRILDDISKCKELEQITNSKPIIYGKQNNTKLNRVFNYIMENFDRRIYLDDVAELVNMTPNAFCRFFKLHTKKTFFSFLIEVRINQACNLLSGGNHNVTETYFACGFNNSSNFHRHFRTQTGFTPTEYRQKNLFY